MNNRNDLEKIASLLRKMLKKLYILILLTVLGSSLCYAGGQSINKQPIAFDKDAIIQSAEENKVLKIGLVDCIAFALKNNSEIKIKRIEPKIREDDVRIAKSSFEPTLTLNGSAVDTRDQPSSPSLYNSLTATSKTTNLDFGIGGKLITGTKYNIDFNNKRYKSNSITQAINPYYKSDATITITQPIFRGAGILVNRADIVITPDVSRILSLEFHRGKEAILEGRKAAEKVFFEEQETLRKVLK